MGDHKKILITVHRRAAGSYITENRSVFVSFAPFSSYDKEKGDKGKTMVKSESTKDMTRIELLDIQENLKNCDDTERERFRESFEADDMGFWGRKEGI